MRRFWLVILSLAVGIVCGAGFMAYRDRPEAHGPWENYQPVTIVKSEPLPDLSKYGTVTPGPAINYGAHDVFDQVDAEAKAKAAASTIPTFSDFKREQEIQELRVRIEALEKAGKKGN